jgi:hypothetical protein
MIGTMSKPGFSGFLTPEKLLAEMDYAGIKESLVYHSLSKEYHPETGNLRLLQRIQGKERIHPCWTLLPPHTNELAELPGAVVPTPQQPNCDAAGKPGMSKPENLIVETLRRGVTAVRLFPNNHFFSLSHWSMGETFKVLEAHRIPTFLDFGTDFPIEDRTDWDAVYEICSTYPALPLILVHFGFRSARKLFPLMEICKNLHVETSGYWMYRGIESISKRFGAHRILFGTYLPFYEPGINLCMVTYAEITTEDKKLIAGNSLRRLLSEVRK